MTSQSHKAPESLALGCCPLKQAKRCLKVYRVVSAVRGLKKLNLLAYSEQEAIKQFSDILGVKPWRAVIWYSYPLQSSVSERG